MDKGKAFLDEIISIYDKGDARLGDELVEIAYKCKEQKKFEQAHLFLKWSYLIYPENSNVLREYGGLYYDEKNYVQALTYWEKLLNLRESCGHYYLCALAYDLLGQYTKAKEYCYSALRFPDDGYRSRAKALLAKLESI